MKVNVNIELFDNTPASAIEELGLTTKFLNVCYEAGFIQYVKSLWADAPGMNYSVSVEIEDNTVN